MSGIAEGNMRKRAAGDAEMILRKEDGTRKKAETTKILEQYLMAAKQTASSSAGGSGADRSWPVMRG